jgi:hypothetical protein
MVIAMPVVHMVQAAVHQEVHVVTVGHHLMPAIVPVVTSTGSGLVLCRIHFANRYGAFVPVSLMLVVQVPVVHIINMVFVLYLGVAARDAVLMRMLSLYRMVF